MSKLGKPTEGIEMTAAAMPSLNLRRVRREDVKADSFIKPDGLDLCLDCWKTWMSRSDTDLGIKSQSTLRAEGDGYGGEDTSQMRRDNEIAEATDAMIRSLCRSHQWAIGRKTGIVRQHVWNFPNLNFITEAGDACRELEIKLRANVATRMVFL